jgi:predicted RNA-binding protein YlqC (UPF0109 family)
MPDSQATYSPFVEAFVRSLLDEPEALEIEEYMDNRVRVFNVHVAPNDVGKLIGRRGRVINQLRIVVSAIASSYKERALVKVVAD